MDFEEYKMVQAEILGSRSDLVRADCLNPFKAMDFLIPDLQGNMVANSVSDVFELWKYNNSGFGPLNVAFSNGVRDSLSILVGIFAGHRWMVPSDVYPKYISITDRVVEREFYELNKDNPFGVCKDFEGILLTECPITPTGRVISKDEVDFLCEFVEKDGNYVVIDTVYAYDFFTVSNRLWKLMKTNKVFVLHSLSKTYLCPEVLGINMVPQNFNRFFESVTINQEGLNRVIEILTKYPRLPIDQEVIFRKSWSGFADTESQGYFRVFDKSFEQYLSEGTLVVPYSVFGGARDKSVMTTLYSQKSLNMLNN